MKHILFVATILTLWSPARAQQRMTLYEEFGGENCCYSAMYEPPFWALCDTLDNPSKLIHITYLLPYGCSGTPSFWYDERTKTINTTRSTFYSSPAVPIGRYDGNIPDTQCGGNIHCFKQEDIDAEAAIPSPFNITVNSQWTDDHRYVNVTVNISCVSGWEAAAPHLRVALIETNDFATPPGANGATHFENVVQAMYPNPLGTPLSHSWAPGTEMNYNITGQLPAWVSTDSGAHIVVWIQDDATREVAQAARSIPAAPTAIGMTTVPVSGISVYPNPATEKASVSFELGHDEDVTLSVIDAVGHVVYTASEHLGMGVHKIDVPLADLAAGLYTVKVQSGSGSTNARLSVVK